MFKEFKEEKIFRFKEFDEARGFIENLKDNKNTFEAIDYMINHKEYYFLLKNVLLQADAKINVISYLFYNLPCLKREDDLEVIEKILKIANEKLKSIIIDYLKTCKNEEFAKKLYLDGLKEEAIEIFKVLPNVSEWLKNKLKNESKDIKRKALEFFEIYDEEYFRKLKEEIGNK